MNEDKKSSYVREIVIGVVSTFIIISILYPIFVNPPRAVIILRYDGRIFPDNVFFSSNNENNYVTEITFNLKNGGSSGGNIFAEISSDKILSKPEKPEELNNYEKISKIEYFKEPKENPTSYRFILMNNNYSEIDEFKITLDVGHRVEILLFFPIYFPGGSIQATYQHKSGEPEEMYFLTGEEK